MERPPALSPELVNAFVGAGHGNLAEVERMLDEQPALVNAAWDWGGGDWETALGAAAHTASIDVAELLLSRGARMDVFCAAAMGKQGLVAAFLAQHPSVATSRGPHGIPLIVHAMIAGQEEIVTLLEAHGAVRPAPRSETKARE